MNQRQQFVPPELIEYGRLSEIVRNGGNDGVPPPYPEGWFDGTTQIRTPECDGGAGPGKPGPKPDAWNHCGSSS
jgi:hypothetical protein